MRAVPSISKPSRRELSSVELLGVGYGVGVVGTLWDWREHLLGPGSQPPHVLIDIGALLVLGVLAFSGRVDLRSRSFMALYGLLIIVILITLGPVILRAMAPSSAVTVALNETVSRGGLALFVPLLLLACWSALRWLALDKSSWWRVTASVGLVIVSAGVVWDVYWHLNHPPEIHASMASLPPHQAIFAGFLIGLVGAAHGSVKARMRSEART